MPAFVDQHVEAAVGLDNFRRSGDRRIIGDIDG
jgi:hypothetical protein